jgi:DNA-binding MarR family transcriptional regulator
VSVKTDEVLIALRRIMRAVDLHSRQLTRGLGVTTPQLIVLRRLAESGPVSAGHLSRAVDLSHGTLTDIVGRLEARGLVHRDRSPLDRRKVVVALTDAGQDTIDRAPPLLQEHFLNEFERLEEWEQYLILSSLQRVASMLRADRLPVAAVLSDEPFTHDDESPRG